MGVLEEKTFLVADKYYHFSEVFLEELKPFLRIKFETLDVLFKPFLSVVGKSPDKAFLNKIKSSIFDCLLNNGNKLLELKKAGDYTDSGDGVEVLGTIALTLGLSAKFFNLGLSLDCLQGNRKVLFSLHEDFLKLEKDLETAGIENSVTQVDEEDADEGFRSILKKARRPKRKLMELMQFEKVAAEVGMDMDGASSCALPTMPVKLQGQFWSSGKGVDQEVVDVIVDWGSQSTDVAWPACFEELVPGFSVLTEVPPIGGKEDSLETILVAKPKVSAEKIIYSPISGHEVEVKALFQNLESQNGIPVVGVDKRANILGAKEVGF
ncbi:hypothetical protein HHK36_013559 [Tetracentron sinense]|uniref:Uncharacterized protein n=1 Tax=Tetracentron sinense TaxID=13715 RepID=A0A835DGV1_TETSI|nr:hypothetical protein HHK36_013559 [Tetracentron sinense]